MEPICGLELTGYERCGNCHNADAQARKHVCPFCMNARRLPVYQQITYPVARARQQTASSRSSNPPSR